MPKRSRPPLSPQSSHGLVDPDRLLLCALLPLGLPRWRCWCHQWPGPAGSPLAGALLLGALGLALTLVQSHGRALIEPLLQACSRRWTHSSAATDHPVPVLRLDESGEVLRTSASWATT